MLVVLCLHLGAAECVRGSWVCKLKYPMDSYECARVGGVGTVCVGVWVSELVTESCVYLCVCVYTPAYLPGRVSVWVCGWGLWGSSWESVLCLCTCWVGQG